MDEGATERGGRPALRFAQTKFRPPPRPGALIPRSVLQDRLNTGAGQQLTVVVGAAGAGKSVLLSSWASARAPDFTAWLSCDEADANPVRFWSGFIEAHRSVMPSFGADAADLLNMDGAVSADVTASIANDAAKLPPRAAVIVDDFHFAELQIMYGIGGERDLTERTIDHLSGWRDSKPVRVGNGA